MSYMIGYKIGASDMLNFFKEKLEKYKNDLH